MKSFTFRGACGLLPLLLMAQELSLTAAAAGQWFTIVLRDITTYCNRRHRLWGSLLQQKNSNLHNVNKICGPCVCIIRSHALVEGDVYEQLLVCV